MSTVFCVLENDRPACYPTKAECWHNWKFQKYEQAFNYAKAWLGQYGENLNFAMLPVGGSFEYNGYDKELDENE